MDHSINQPGMTNAHQRQRHTGSAYPEFMDEVHAYAGAGGNSNNDDYNFQWDPALFASVSDIDSPYQTQTQQPQSHPSYEQALSRQTNNSPALPRFQSSQHTQSPYSHNGYGHNLLESRTAAQPSFDPRFISGSTGSPAPFEDYSYHQPQLGYNNQQQPHYNQMPQQYQPQRQTATPPQYVQPQRTQQATQQYMNIAPARPPSQLAHMQNTEGMFHQFRATPPASHQFIHPSMLSNNAGSVNGVHATMQQPQQPIQPAPYYVKPGSVDPHIMQQMNMGKASLPTATQNTLPAGSTIQNGQPLPLQTNVHDTNVQQPSAKDVLVAKKPKAKAAKASKAVNLDGPDVDSPDELEIEDEPPEMKPALLSVGPPTDLRSKALFDAVQAVWSPRNYPAPPEKVRSGLAAFGETVRLLRDAWKAKNEALKKAELPNSETAGQAGSLKEQVAHFRQIMELIMSRSLQFGHDSIVKRLGENQFTLSALYSFMLDRANAGDYDSTLVTHIYQFAVKFETLDEEKLETVKWTKILQRFTKKATNASKDLAKQILTNAAAQSARKRAAKSEDAPGSPASLNGNKSLSSGIKRARDGDLAGPVPKKLVKPASKPLALQHAERRKALEKEAASKSGIKPEKGDPKLTVARPKVTMVAPHKTNAFAGLLSASKKPGTSIAEKAAASTIPKEKPKVPVTVTTIKQEEGRKEPSPPRTSSAPGPVKSSSSAFMSFLTDIDKPKDSATKKIEEFLDESEEQRVKRLRKEARRKLRVTWKPDSSLVETRLFTHDPDEETGHADSMMRDAGDTMKEGEMLKLHKDVDDIDDDEENDDTGLDADEYRMPSEVDFSVLGEDAELNFYKFGGSKKAESAASDAQNKHEENTLMAIYTFKSDRPDTPKELPSVNEDDDFQPVVDFGELEDKVRQREKQFTLMRQPPQTPSQSSTGFDLAAQLRAMAPQQAQTQQPSSVAFDLQRTLSMLSQQNRQSTPAPAAATANGGGLDLSKLLAVMQQANSLQQQQQQQPPQQPPQSQFPTSSMPPAQSGIGYTPDLAALVAQVTGNPQSQGLPLGSSGNPNPYPGASDFSSRKHDRSDDQDAQGGKKKKQKAPLGPDGKPLNYKTQVCHFYKEGKCIKGDNCTYRHDE